MAQQKNDDEMRKSDADIVKQALEDYERGYDKQKANIDQAYDDLKFRAADGNDQWTREALAARKGRPCMTINRIPQFVRQITGDMRQMRPAIKVVPVDSRGDVKTADVIAGMVRYIENRSMARAIYTKAGDSQVNCGIGHVRVHTEYASTTTFNQEIRIALVEDGVSVIWDPDSTSPVHEDAMWCHVPVDLSKKTFEKRWPGKRSENFGEDAGKYTNVWFGSDFVRVSEYWVREPAKRLLVLMPDGAVDDLTDQADEAVIAAAQAQGGRVEWRESHKICRYLLTCSEVLEKTEWPGRHIPIVPFKGEEVIIGPKLYRHGVIRYAKDPQRLYNYYLSANAEVMALQPKAPFLVTDKNVEDHADEWETANEENLPYLTYTPDPRNGGTRPERMPPPVGSSGLREAALQANEDMKGTMGIYDASLGARGNETSGRAILARQREGDVGSFVYIDNFAFALQRVGQIVVDLIPEVYDTERQIRILGEDGKMDTRAINRPVMVGGREAIEHDVTAGAYDVMIDTGPSFTTQREEAKDAMREFIQSLPAAAPLIGDLYAKAQDWPHAEEIGKRLELMLPEPVRMQLQEERGGAALYNDGNGAPTGGGAGAGGRGGAMPPLGPDGQPLSPERLQMMQMRAQQQAVQEAQHQAHALAQMEQQRAAMVADAQAQAAIETARAGVRAAAANAERAEIQREIERAKLGRVVGRT